MRLLLEGPDIEELLAQVRREHGSSARIIAADKIRSGGVAGFFARERYEVTVEIDDASPVPVLRNEILQSTTFPNAAPVAELRSPAAPRADLAGSAGGGVPVSTVVESAAPTTLLELAAAVEHAERATEVRFQPMAPAPALSAPVSAIPAQRPPVVPAVEPAPVVSTETQGFAAVMRQLADDTAEAAASGGPVEVRTVPGRHVRRGTDVTQAAVEAAAVQPTAVHPTAVQQAAVQPTTAAHRRGGVLQVVEDVPTATEVALARQEETDAWAALGLPAELHPQPADGVPAVRLLRSALERLPQPPRVPRNAGDVIVVAGPAAQAYRAAQQVASRLRLDPAAVLLAAASSAVPGVEEAKRLLGPDDARRRLRGIRRTACPTLVAVDAAMEDGAAEWAREVADELEADALWAVVDATTKTSDAAAHLERLAPVQALLVRNARRTADPASVLGLGIPVVGIDGVPATPSLWASLLCERLLETA